MTTQNIREKKGRPSSGHAKAAGDQRGVALVIALVLLMLLGMLGAFALSTSMTELRISGNFRNYQEAFYTGDSAVEQVATDQVVRATIQPTAAIPVTTWPNGPGTSPVTVGRNTAQVRLEWVRRDNAPPMGYGFDVVLGEGKTVDYVSIRAVGGGPNNTQTEIESMVIWVN